MRASIVRIVLLGISFFLTFPSEESRADEFIVNGGFEDGSLAGWSNSGFYIASGPSTPLNGLDTAGPASGTFYAVSDSSGAGTRYLVQTIAIPASFAPSNIKLILSFDMFVNNWNFETIVNPIGLDASDGPNQHATVDILAGGAAPLDTGSGVLRNLYIGADSGFPPNPYTHYSFDLSDLLQAGGTYQLRFAEVDTELFLNLGVDNVSLGPAQVITGVTPEPSAIVLFGTGLGALACSRFRK